MTTAIDPAIAAFADLIDPPRSPYIDDPVAWSSERLGEFWWSKQREIAESVRDNRRTAVHSCHDAGKSYIASRIVCWWLDSHPPGSAFVVSTAPTFRQVRNILWREINKAVGTVDARVAKGDTDRSLPGRVNQTEWWIGNEIVAFGAKPKDEAGEDENATSDAFQGIHTDYVLVVLDEACGVPEILWNAADALITNEASRILAIGNPDDPTSRFKRVCDLGSEWNVIHIDGYETPNFTDEKVPDVVARRLLSRVWVDEVTREWGEESSIFEAKVRGRFSLAAANSVVPQQWVEQCRVGRDYHNRDLETRGQYVELGVDVGAGGDESVIYAALGPLAELVKRDRDPDTMKTAGLVLQAIHEYRPRAVKIDVIGIGKGIVDRLTEQKRDGHPDLAGVSIVGVNVGTSSDRPERFPRLRDQIWWEIGRGLTEHGGWDLSQIDDKSMGDLCAPTFHFDSSRRICVERKEDTKKRLRRSPDSADALLLAFFTPSSSESASLSALPPSQGTVVRRGDLVLRGRQYIDKEPA